MQEKLVACVFGFIIGCILLYLTVGGVCSFIFLDISWFNPINWDCKLRGFVGAACAMLLLFAICYFLDEGGM